MPVFTQSRWQVLHWIHAAVPGALSAGAAYSSDSGGVLARLPANINERLLH